MRHEHTDDRNVVGDPTKSPLTFGRIMIGVDHSVTSQWALQVGGSLAARVGAAVALVHVIDLSKGFAPELGVIDDRLISELRVSGADLLVRSGQSLLQELTCEREVREGEPAEQIVAAADEWRADVVVVGAHARGPVARFLLGSTAETVVRRAHCPVLTVGHKRATSGDSPGAHVDQSQASPALASSEQRGISS